ncbi:pyridoxamine 5'-phosphate oxidase family protein [Kitasatospora sp. NPDC002227]|uniref:pyridoxine 5'-phosphate oxidase C-terminal domain-containing protein n=1 Tax=Kitasatospora sp. NPDC002227 TaxID=3154773 RepID=UPI0033186814
MSTSRPVDELRHLLRTQPPMNRPLPGFDPAAAPADPGTLHVEWLLGAMRDERVADAQVVTVSTADRDGHPDARILVLRDIDAERGAWSFHADARSPKGRQLADRPWAALTSYWPALGRQVRLRGPVEATDLARLPAAERALSPAGERALWVGRQSEPLTGLDACEAAWAAAAEPAQALQAHTRYTVLPEQVEFWQGAPTRRHLRLAYHRRPDGAWDRTLLWP